MGSFKGSFKDYGSFIKGSCEGIYKGTEGLRVQGFVFCFFRFGGLGVWGLGFRVSGFRA